MLTNEDIKKLKKILPTKKDLAKFATKKDLLKFATKEDLAKLVTLDEFDQFRKETREEFKDLRKLFNELAMAVDAYAKKADTYFQEILALAQKVDRHERWIHQIAEKIGIKLEY
jgi:uncharacterized coiled-coil DUF342 family protein